MPVHVLLVDDEPQILAALKRLLLRRGYDVSTAPNAEKALVLLETLVPDVVVSDFKMPGLNGAQLLAEVSKAVPTARQVLLSGYAEVAGAQFGGAFLRKPWDDAELLSVCALGALP
jgi:adenylate cyclase